MPLETIAIAEEDRGSKEESRKRRRADNGTVDQTSSSKLPRTGDLSREVTESPHAENSAKVIVSYQSSPSQSPAIFLPLDKPSTEIVASRISQPETSFAVRPPISLKHCTVEVSENALKESPPIITTKELSTHDSNTAFVPVKNPLQHQDSQSSQDATSFAVFSSNTYSDICIIIFGIFASLPILFPKEQNAVLPEPTIHSNLERNKAIFGTIGVWLLFVQMHYVLHIARDHASTMSHHIPLNIQRFGQQCRQCLKAFVDFSSLTVNQDKLLRFIQFGIWFVANLYAPNTEGRQSLKVVSFEVGLARYVTRFLGWPSALEALWNGTWTKQDNSSTHPRWSQFFGDLSALGMMIYFPNEHVAFLHVKTPQWVQATAGSGELWCSWSARGWVAAIASDIAQGIVNWKDAVHEQCSGISTNSSHYNQIATRKKIQQAKFQILANALILFPALREGLAPEWKEFGYWFTEDMANFLQLMEAIVVLYEATV